MTEYHYRDLDPSLEEFRVLILKPSNRRHKIINCDLVTTNARQHGSRLLSTYKAVSYAWGPEDNPTRILLGGILHSVTKNLACLLARLRQSSTSVYLWVDALCINQKNEKEKQHQIGLMWKIYGNAPGLIIWLGEDTGKNDTAMKVVERNEKFYSTSIHPLTATSAEISCFRTLTGQSWWKRAWIVQEFILGTRPSQEAKTQVLYGRSELPWPRFRDAFHRLAEFNARGRQQYPLIDNILVLDDLRSQYYQNISTQKTSVLWWLSKTRAQRSSDPRDKLFALQSLSNENDELSRNLVANYQLSTTQLYTSFAIAALLSASGLEILRHCQRRCIEGLPSWVPDWSVSTDVNPLWNATDVEQISEENSMYDLEEEYEVIQTKTAIILREVQCPRSHYNASAGKEPSFSINAEQTNTFQSRGIICDDIDIIHEPFVENVTEPWENATRFMIAVGECKTMQEQFSETANPYQNQTGRLNAFWRSLMADHAGDNQYRPYICDDFMKWLPTIPEDWASGVVHNVTTRPDIYWRNKTENMLLCHRFSEFLRDRDIQLNGYSWSDFDSTAFSKLPAEVLEHMSETNEVEDKLFETLIKDDSVTPYFLKVMSYQIANRRSPEILLDSVEYHAKEYGQYLISRWDLQDQLANVAETWEKGPYDLINSPFCLPSVIPDPYESQRGDPDIKYELGWMEEEAIRLDPSLDKHKIKLMPADNVVGYGGDKGREKYALGRSFFITKKGYMGLAPPDARPGDAVAVLFGSKVPFVLRPRESGTFELIGETHVQGLMDGQAVEMLQAGEMHERMISIL